MTNSADYINNAAPITFPIALFYFLLSAFAAFASYRLHLEGFEEIVGDGLDSIINGSGRAPDQYRILPYLILAAMKMLLNPVFGDAWKFSIIIFETLSLFGSVLILRRLLSRHTQNPIFLIILLLIYPYSMFDGVRSIASFILFLSSFTLLLFPRSNPSLSIKLGFYTTLLLFSLTRADVALLIGLICSFYMSLAIWEKILITSIPIAIQVVLSSFVYPHAEYYSDLFMVVDNLSLSYFINNPLTYFLVALVICYWKDIKEVGINLYTNQKIVLLLIVGYLLTVFIIGRPNEYRLFLPLVPVFLLITDKNYSLKIQNN